MSTGIEHHREAERLLTPGVYDEADDADLYRRDIARAQVHATLALAAATDDAAERYRQRAETARDGRVSKAVKPWREDIRWHLLGLPAADRAEWPFDGPVTVHLAFVLRRPKSTPKRMHIALATAMQGVIV